MENQTAKKEKVGADGLSKKERRALKVQAKGTTNTAPTIPPQNTNNAKAQAPTNPKDKTKTLRTEKVKDENKDGAKEPSEKLLRKLEWEKKLAEQKGIDADNKEALSKAELKAKRREKQDADRLAKTATLTPKTTDLPSKLIPSVKPDVSPKIELIKKVKITARPKRTFIKRKKDIQVHKVQLVEHLYVEKSPKSDPISQVIYNDIHPAFVKLGVQYASKTVLGSNARCLALLAALKRLVSDVQIPPKQEYSRYLETVLKSNTNYLNECRPTAVCMTNALRHFKLHLTQVDTTLEDDQKRNYLLNVIDTYISDDIKKAGEAISIKVREKISNGDIILTYGCSSLITRILLEAHKDEKQFTVIVTDGRPLSEGKEMLRRLVVAGIDCKYILINGVSYVMSSVTKVILGAHALLTNGYVMSRIGTAQVALVAEAYNKPVLVCCETYKFSERVQTDSFVYNEIDNPDKFTDENVSEVSSPLSNLLYDVTPSDFITAVFTERAIIPCTSVPVVLRINANEG